MSIQTLLNKYKSLSIPVKAALWYTICNFINKGMALVTTPIFTRILTEEQFGTFSIFQSWFNILIIFTSLNIFLSGYTKGLILFKEDKEAFTSSQLSLTSIITIVFFCVYLINVDFWNNVFDLSTGLVVAMFIELLVMPAFEFWSAKERFEYKYKNIIKVSIGMNFLCLLFSVIAIVFSNHKVEARIFSDVFVKFLIAGTIFIILIRNGKKIIKKEYWKYALKFNLPLIPHYLSNYILNQSDRLMIGKMVGKVQAAYYSISNTISNVMMLLVLAINNSLTPYIYQSIEKNEIGNIKSKISPLLILITILSIIVMLIAPEVIYIFAGKNYMEAIYVIPPITASVYFIFVYSLFSNIEYYFQKTASIAIATTFSAILNIILNFFGIKFFGYYAAGYTTLICYICLSIFHYKFYKKIIKSEFEIEKNIYNVKLIMVLGLGLILVMLLMLVLYTSNILRYSIIVILALIILANMKKISKIIKEYNKIK